MLPTVTWVTVTWVASVNFLATAAALGVVLSNSIMVCRCSSESRFRLVPDGKPRRRAGPGGKGGLAELSGVV